MQNDAIGRHARRIVQEAGAEAMCVHQRIAMLPETGHDDLCALQAGDPPAVRAVIRMRADLMDMATARTWHVNDAVDGKAILLDVCERVLEIGSRVWRDANGMNDRPCDAAYRSAIADASLGEALAIIGTARLGELAERTVELARQGRAQDAHAEALAGHPAMLCATRTLRTAIAAATAHGAVRHAELRVRLHRDAALGLDTPSAETVECAGAILDDLMDGASPTYMRIEDLKAWGLPVRLDVRPVRVVMAILKDSVLTAADDEMIPEDILTTLVNIAAAEWATTCVVSCARLRARLATLVQIDGRSGK